MSHNRNIKKSSNVQKKTKKNIKRNKNTHNYLGNRRKFSNRLLHTILYTFPPIYNYYINTKTSQFFSSQQQQQQNRTS